jgi:hypothetical protein
VIVDKLFNFGPRAKNNWYALMRPAWLEIHDRAEVGRCRCPARSMIIAIGFASYIKRSLPPASRLLLPVDTKHAAARQDAVNFGHH